MVTEARAALGCEPTADLYRKRADGSPPAPGLSGTSRVPETQHKAPQPPLLVYPKTASGAFTITSHSQ
jgi:hypothetical protein